MEQRDARYFRSHPRLPTLRRHEKERFVPLSYSLNHRIIDCGGWEVILVICEEFYYEQVSGTRGYVSTQLGGGLINFRARRASFRMVGCQ
jgi:hypothetical protein